MKGGGEGPDLVRQPDGGRILACILAGFALAAAIAVLKEGGRNLGMVFGIMGRLVAFCFLLLWLVTSLAMKRQIAELTRSGDVLLAEMVHMFGRGRRVEIPVSSADNSRGWASPRASAPPGNSHRRQTGRPLWRRAAAIRIGLIAARRGPVLPARHSGRAIVNDILTSHLSRKD